MRRMIQDATLSFPLFQRATIIKAANPYRKTVIRLLLFGKKWYWVAMMDFEANLHDTYYVGKEFNEAVKIWQDELDVYGPDDRS